MKKLNDPFTLQDYTEYQTIKALQHEIPALTPKMVRSIRRDRLLRCSVRKAMRADRHEIEMWITTLDRLLRKQLAEHWFKQLQEQWEFGIAKCEPTVRRKWRAAQKKAKQQKETSDE